MDKKYIEQAKYLRSEFFKTIVELSSYENDLKKYKDDLDSMDLSEKKDSESALAVISEFERKITEIEQIISPKVKYIKELEKQADTLFENIKSFYPDMTMEELQQELIPHLEEIKLKL